jgi:molybdenum-dependent DNA-binding transcriptional regulator ModE
MNTYKIEITDTFGGEANYSWLRVLTITARSIRGAINKASRQTGYSFRKEWDSGDCVRYNAVHSCVCAFVEQI